MIEEKVIDIILGFSNQSNINMNDTLRSLGIDSLKVVDVVLALEQKFNIKISDADLDIGLMGTVSNVIDLVKKYLSNED